MSRTLDLDSMNQDSQDGAIVGPPTTRFDLSKTLSSVPPAQSGGHGSTTTARALMGVPRAEDLRRIFRLARRQISKQSVCSEEEQLCSEMRESIDRIIDEMGKRFDQLHRLVLKFGVLIPSNFFDEDYSFRIDEHSVDIEISGFVTERLRLQSFVHVVDEEIRTSLIGGGPLELLKFILKWSLQATVPNVVILLRIFLTVGVSVSSCERSFSKLKLIKNYLRSSMTSSRLSDLSILSIEHEETDRIDFDSVISDFAEKKARKVCLK